ncbi:MAG: hypothetical protein H6581_18280 [Bacteroidia bacterium]|nr:hypothetical protein [Bacteroidia bacterium]
MKKPDIVFELVKLLGQGEKRNLIQLSKLQKGPKDYLKLLQAMEEVDEYEEEKIKSKIRIRNFAYTKNYLYTFILKSIFVYEQSDQMDLIRGIRYVKYLTDRSLYTGAKKLTIPLKEKAAEAELFDESERLLELELELLIKSQDVAGLQEGMLKINKEQKEVEKIRDNLREYKQLYNELYLISRTKFMARGEMDVRPLEELAKNKLMQSEDQALSTRARIQFYKNKFNIERFNNNYNACIEFSRKILECYENHPFLLNENISDYINEVKNLSLLYLSQDKEKEALDTIDKIEKFNVGKEMAHSLRFEQYYSFFLAYSVDTGNIEKGMTVIAELEKGIEKYKPFLSESTLINFFYFSSVFLLIAGRPRESFEWLIRILGFPKTEVRKDLQAFARIMVLIVLFELKDQDLVENYRTSSHRYLKKRERLFSFEDKILKFFGKIYNFSGESQQHNEFKALYEDLQKLFADPYEQRVLFYFDILSWLKAKIERRPMVEIIQEK